MVEVTAWGMSDVGLARSHNEDCFEIDPEHRLYLVADGMGGHSHGEVASRIAVEAIRGVIAAAPLENGCDSQRQVERLERAFHVAHDRVLDAIREDVSLHGMGTTVVGLLLGHGQAVVAHVGDSRAYRLRRGELELLTQDHTWVNEQVVAGYLSQEQARVHPLKNVVTRALGGEGTVAVDVREVSVEPGDRYLLCSDGLTTMLRDPEIAAQMATEAPLEKVGRALVGEAQARGGFDDITVLLLAVAPAGRPAG